MIMVRGGKLGDPGNRDESGIAVHVLILFQQSVSELFDSGSKCWIVKAGSVPHGEVELEEGSHC